MARKLKCPSGPNLSYLISFGDTMTALLAFFIVLNSLAKEQTGANLHAGTGSFVKSTRSFGLAGKIDVKRSKQPFQLGSNSPSYIVPDPEENVAPGGKGPDEDSDDKRILDRQKEQFHRFLREVRRLNDVKEAPGIASEVNFDVLSHIPKEGPFINVDIKAVLKEVAPVLRRGGHEVEIVVWATMPSETAWSRAIQQATGLRDESIQLLRLSDNQKKSLTAVARPWFSKTLKRPSVTVVVKRLR